MDVATTVDRYTILLLKQKHGLLTDGDELERCTQETKGIDYTPLLIINRKMWAIEDLITDESDLSKIGAYCLALRGLNQQRIVVRNEIAIHHGQSIEVKNY